jgi:tryptophanyl-tRNA synthetase
MSKSYNNYIDIFLPEKELKKKVMSIQTDSTPMEEPKNPDTCNVYKIFSLLASAEQTQALRANYLAGNYGYGHAKTTLFELLLENFKEERIAFDAFINDKNLLETKLIAGSEKAKAIALPLLKEVRSKVGY